MLQGEGRELREGDRVWANWGGSGDWFTGEIVQVSNDAEPKYSIKYDDGDFEEGVALSCVRMNTNGQVAAVQVTNEQVAAAAGVATSVAEQVAAAGVAEQVAAAGDATAASQQPEYTFLAPAASRFN